MTMVDVVAEAIYTAVTGAALPWDELSEVGHGEYRRMAEAAIKAMELTEETQLRVNWVPVKDSPYAGHARPKGRVRWHRFVSDWVRADT